MAVQLALIAAKKAAVEAAKKRAAQKAAQKATDHGGVVRLVAAAALVPFVLLGLVVLGVGGGGMKPAAAAGSCATGQAVPSSADVPPSTQDAINALKADYEAVATQENLGWNLLAAIDYRENGNSPNLSMLGGEPIGTAAADSGQVSTSKRDSIVRGAQLLKSMASSVYGVNLTASSGGDDVKRAALAYNRGYIYQRAGADPSSSPYVMNQYDGAHTDMVWPNVPGEPLAGQTEYGRFGAFTLFARLGGAAGGCGLSDVDIVRIAQQQLGLRETPDGCNCGDEIQKFLGSSPGEEWCADFTSWVYNEAGHGFTGGLDGGWRIANVSVMHDFVAAHGAWFDSTSPEDPHPGDVITFRDDGHVGIVESLDDGGTPGNPNDDTIHTIEGNTSNMVARRSYGRVGDTVVGWGRRLG